MVAGMSVMWIVSLVALSTISDDDRAPRRYDLVIAPGTDELVAAGENPLSIPSEWDLVSGDVLVLDNRDAVEHSLGAWTAAPGEQREIVLRPFDGLIICSLHPSGQLTMNVEPAQTDWSLAAIATLAFGPMVGLGTLGVLRVSDSLHTAEERRRGPRRLRPIAFTTGGLALLALAASVIVLRPQAEHPAATLNGFVESPLRDVGALALPEAVSGTPVPFVAPEGGLLLVFFGYTSCPDVCPTTLSTFANALEDVGSARVRLAMVTVDPTRDTAVAMDDYVRYFVDDALALRTTDLGALDQAVAAFGASYELGVPTAEGSYEVAHSAFVYGVDDTGHVVVGWPNELGWEAIAHDLRLLTEDTDPRRSA